MTNSVKKTIKVLSTRKLPSQLRQQAAQRGIVITCQNFITIKPGDPEYLQAVLQPLAQQEITALITSRNAVESIADSIDTKEVKWKFFCIATKTRELIAATFPQSEIIASAPDGERLAQKIIAAKATEQVFFFCGNRRMDTIPNRLSSAGISLQEVVVYQTALTPISIYERVEGILFFSPSGVASFFSENEIDDDVVLFTIGATTAKVVRSYVPNRILVAEQAAIETLVKLVFRYFQPTIQSKNI